MDIYCLVFDDYETLDLMGAVEFLARIPNARLHYVSQNGGLIRSKQGFNIETKKLETLFPYSVLLVVGGQGTRQLVKDKHFISQLGKWIDQAEICLSVCTGSALLACTGRLDGIKATSNKKSFEWVKECRPAVQWQAVARWVKDGKFYTSSGVSAGMDMALDFISDHYGETLADEIANHTEYQRQKNPKIDHFAKLYGYEK